MSCTAPTTLRIYLRHLLCLSVCLSVCLSACLSACLPVCLLRVRSAQLDRVTVGQDNWDVRLQKLGLSLSL